MSAAPERSQAPNRLAEQVLDYIHEKSKVPGGPDIMKYLADTNAKADGKPLRFALCVTPLAMGLSDWFLHALGDYSYLPTSTSPKDLELQQALEKHIDVDENHWEWFLKDLRTLGLDQSIPLTAALRLLWGWPMLHSRMIIARLVALVRHARPIMRLAALQTFEEGAAVAFAHFREAGQKRLKEQGKPQEELFYFGVAHKEQEDQHAGEEIRSIPDLIRSYEWTAPEVEEAKWYVDEAAKYYEKLGQELLEYAKEAEEHGDFWPQTKPDVLKKYEERKKREVRAEYKKLEQEHQRDERKRIEGELKRLEGERKRLEAELKRLGEPQ